MNIIVPKEIYPLEKRVIVLPSSAKTLIDSGHTVYVQAGAGSGVYVSDEDYKRAGATIVSNERDLYSLASWNDNQSGLIVKLKQPMNNEFSLMHNTILASMFHSEQNPENIYYAGLNNLVVVELEKIIDKKNERLIDQTFETGQIGVFYACQHSPKIPSKMKALVLGYGRVSTGAIDMCSNLKMSFKIVRRKMFPYIEEHLKDTDLLINGIAWPESARLKKEYLVTRDNIRNSSQNLIILDLSVDFPNPIETIKPTTYMQPYYLEEGRVHISIYGYPGLFPVSSSETYSEQVLPILLAIANNKGLKRIESGGDLGRYIKKAVLDPKKMYWEKYRPPEISNQSKIE